MSVYKRVSEAARDARSQSEPDSGANFGGEEEYASPLDQPTLDEKASTQLGLSHWENPRRRDCDE